MNLQGRSLIAGSLDATGGREFHAVNPANGETLEPLFHSATVDGIDRAARLASKAFSRYGRTSGAERGAFLRAIAERLEAHGNDLVARAGLETALPEPRLRGELGRTTSQLRMFASLAEEGSWVDARIDHGDPGRKPLPKPDVRSMLRPLGPVAVFGASNFPLAFSVAGGDTASALAAGCPVIVKAHPSHPGTSELAGMAILEAVEACSLPDGVVSLLFDAGHEGGVALVRHPAIRAVGFTGSRRGGTALMEIAASRPEPIPIYAEMGSINPVFVLPGAMQERGAEIAAGLHASVTLGVGQFCTNPGLVLGTAGATMDSFLASLEEGLKRSAPAAMLNGAICASYRGSVDRFASVEGVERRVSVPVDTTGGHVAGAALFVANDHTFLSHEDLSAEIFGPSTLVVRCATKERLLDVAASLEGQLTATVHATASDLEDYPELVEILEQRAGRVLFNGYPTGVEVCDAMVHGGPYPATSDGRTTSVGTRAIERFARLVAWQNAPETVLPEELHEGNPLRIRRRIDGAPG